MSLPAKPPLLPPEVQALLPAWRSTKNEDDPIARVKLRLPGTGWTWYVVEYDGKNECFGLVVGAEVEAGSFWLSELEGLYDDLVQSGAVARYAQQGIIISPVERDIQFTPAPLSELTCLHSQQEASAKGMPQP